MARNVRVNSNKDLSMVVEPQDNDCFGLEYSSKAKECKVCGDFAACMSVYKKVIQQKAASKEYLDTTDFSVIDRNKLANILKNEPQRYSDTVEYVRLKAKSTYVLAEKWLDFLLDEHFLQVKNGYICQ